MLGGEHPHKPPCPEDPPAVASPVWLRAAAGGSVWWPTGAWVGLPDHELRDWVQRPRCLLFRSAPGSAVW